MSLVTQLTQVLAPWQDLYSNSVPLSTTITTVHVLSLVVGGGLAIAADRASLRLSGRGETIRSEHLGEMRAVHRPVLISLVLLFVSGLLLFASDVKTYVGSWVFWTKMGLIVLLLVNGAILERTEAALRAKSEGIGAQRRWTRLRLLSVLSITLWLATAVAGEVLVNAG
jgi:hypothetical protein